MPTTAQDVAQAVATNIQTNGGTLAITGTDLGSDAITALFTSYLPDATLTVTGAVQGTWPGGTTQGVTVNAGTSVTGTGGAGPFLGMSIVLVFSVVDDEVVLQLIAVTQAGWTFATSFSQLADTLFTELVFTPAPCFYLASQNGGDFQEGLFFRGALQFTQGSALASASWLLGDGTEAIVYGPVEVHQGVPEVSLAADMAAGVMLGWFQIAPVTLNVLSYVGSTQIDKTPVLTTTLQMDSALRFHTDKMDVTLPLSAEFGPDSSLVQFYADLNDLLYLGFSELESLLNGVNLGSIQFPAGFSLSQTVALEAFVLQVDLDASTMAEKVCAVTAGIRSATPWTLLSDPTYGSVLTVQEVAVSFIVDDPMTSPSIGAAIFGQVQISNTGNMSVGAIYHNAFTVQGELAEGAAINLTQLAAYFLNTAPDPDVPPIEVVELSFSATPSTSAYSLAVAVENAWSISLGSTQLSIEELAFAISTAGGTSQARIGGVVTIGPAIISLDWQMPGTFSLNGTIPEILLSELIAGLSPGGTSWIDSFPTITLENTTLAIQRFQNGGYFLAAGSTVDGFGTFEIEFSEIGGSTGFTFGFSLVPGWRLTQLSSVFDVALLSDLEFENATLVLSTNDNPNFSFHSLTPQGNNLTPILPGQSAGVMAGMYFYADLKLDVDDDTAMGTVAKLLQGSNPATSLTHLTVSLAIPANYQNTVFVAGLTSSFSLFDTITLNSLSVTIKPFQEYLDLAMMVTFNIQGHSFALEGGVVVAGADAEIYLRTATPWVEPFGIKGLTLQAMAVGFVVDNAGVSLQGQVKLGSGKRAITLTAAMEFSLAEEVPDVFMVKEVGSVSLADIIHAFVASAAVPSALNNISLFDFRFLIVANPVGWTDLLTKQHYSAGVAFSGKVQVCSLVPSVAMQVDYATGIHASGQLDNPLVIGNVVTIANASDPTKGPFIQINSAQAPYVSMSIALTLYEISKVQAVATVSNNAFNLSFDYTIAAASSIGKLSASASLVNGNQFNLAASCSVSLPSFGPLKVGKYSLGTIASGFSVAGSVNLTVGPGVAISLAVSGGFVLGGYNMVLPSVNVALSSGQFSGFSQLPSYFVGVLKDQLWTIGAELFQNAEALFRWVRSAAFSLTSDIGHVLGKYFSLGLNAAAQYLASVASVMRYAVTDVAALLKSGFNAVDEALTQALISARYAIGEVAQAVATVFKYGAEAIASVLKSVGCSLSDIASMLKQLFGYSAKDVAKFFKSAWKIADHLVMDALNAAEFAVDKIEKAMQDVFDWTSKMFHEIVDDLNPTHW